MKKVIAGLVLGAGLFAPFVAFAMPCTDSTCYPMPVGTGTGNPGHNK
jgi:hypothetical protein